MRAVFTAIAAGLLTLSLTASAASAQEVWFSPPDDHPRGKQHLISAEDYSRLFEHPEEWSSATAHVRAFGVDMSLAIDGPEEKLRRIFGFLKDHKIAANVSLQSLYTENCGRGIEGLVTVQHFPGDVLRRLKRLGLDVTYVSLDGPLGFGHTYRGKEECRYSAREVARRLAYTVRDVRSSYPNAKFVDYEGDFTYLPQDEAMPLLREWLDAYRAETGTELDALGMDVDWRKPWRTSAPPTADILHAHGVKAGIFLDAAGGPTVTDESWMAEAERNARDIVTAKLPVDFVIIASWMMHPKRLLPESDPLALTHLVDWYEHYKKTGAAPAH